MRRLTDGTSRVAAAPVCGTGDLMGSRHAAARSTGRRVLQIAACSVGLALLVSCLMIAGRGFTGRARPPRLHAELEPLGVAAGEFERQGAILLAWPREASPSFSAEDIDLSRRQDRVFCEVVQAVWRSVDVIVLIADARSHDRAARLLSEAQVPREAVQFVQIPFDTEWIRDYGPIGVKTSAGSCTMIDADYVDNDFICLDPHDDRLPSALGAILDLPAVRAPIAVQHGNLLSNGRGLCVTTRRLLDDNAARGYDEDDVRAILKRFYGAEEVVFVDMLRGEATSHVDMFATFTSPDTIVVGRCPHQSDPINAEILDCNARRLASLGPPFGPLTVVRIPMPPRVPSGAGRQSWPTYTNVVYANGTLLVPVYPGLDPAGESHALALYRQLLPGWKILGIDSGPLLEVFGGPHCMTMNLPSVAKRYRAGSAGRARPSPLSAG